MYNGYNVKEWNSGYIDVIIGEHLEEVIEKFWLCGYLLCESGVGVEERGVGG